MLVLVAALIAAVGCKDRRATSREATPLPPVAAPAHPDDAQFVIATPQVATARVPVRFDAPLPSTDAAIVAAPPPTHVETALAAGTFDMRQRALDAMTRAAPLTDPLNVYYRERLEEALPAACDWVASVATGTAPAAVRSVFWATLGHCDGPATAAALARDDAPDAAIIS